MSISLVKEFEKIVKSFNTIVFGDDDQDVVVDGITKPTISKIMLGIKSQFNGLKSEMTNLQSAINTAAAAGAGENGWTDLLVATASGRTQRDKNSELISILDFFTVDELTAFSANPSMDCTAIIKRAFATGVKKVNFLDLQMHITPDVATGLGIIFASGDIELYGNGATFIDDTVYPNNDKVAALFTLGGAVTSFKSNINYVGKQVNLSTQIGYVGATYVYSKGANKNITVNAYLENIRYGILCGNYALPELGGTKGIRGWLRCKNVGYPIATYLADDIEMTITGDGFHRAHYIAGCNHARMITRTKNYYIAPIPNLYTDAKTGDGTSKGCSDCQTDATDLGSTNYVANSHLLGVSLSRVDPNTIFDNIVLNGKIISNDTQASTLGHTLINSSAKNYQPSYAANWDSTIVLSNISITGTIDRSLQTIAEHASGEVYLAARDDISLSPTIVYPKIKNLKVDIDYFAGSGSKSRGFWIFLDGLMDLATLRLNAKNSGVNVIRSNTSSLIKIINSDIVGVDASSSSTFNSVMELINTKVSNSSYLPTVNKRLVNTSVAGNYSDSGLLIKTLTYTQALSGNTVTIDNALPINSLIVGISFVIIEDITGGTSGLQIGISSAATKFYNVLSTKAGQGASISNSTPACLPYQTPGTTGLLITARDGIAFAGGKIKVVVNYIQIPVPTV